MSSRKVCNHPDLFEERPIVSPFRMLGLHRRYPSLLQTASERLVNNNSDYTNRTDPFLHASLLSHNLVSTPAKPSATEGVYPLTHVTPLTHPDTP